MKKKKTKADSIQSSKRNLTAKPLVSAGETLLIEEEKAFSKSNLNLASDCINNINNKKQVSVI